MARPSATPASKHPLLLSRIWPYRLSRIGLIPPEARVNPIAFPEDEFPVFCPSCCYPLQGLPGPACPECGQPFDRGRLLVEQYIIEQASRPANRGRPFRVGLWMLICLAGMVIGGIALSLYTRARFQNLGGVLDRYSGLAFATAAALMLIPQLLMLAVALRSWRSTRPYRPLIRRVTEALDQTTPAFQRARVRQRWVWIAWGTVTAGGILLAYSWRLGSRAFRTPTTLVGLGIAGLCIIVLVVVELRAARKHKQGTPPRAGRDPD